MLLYFALQFSKSIGFSLPTNADADAIRFLWLSKGQRTPTNDPHPLFNFPSCGQDLQRNKKRMPLPTELSIAYFF